MYQPLTQEQYQKARAAGFTADQIIANEQIRKAQESVPTPPSEPTPSPLRQIDKTTNNVANTVLSVTGGKNVADAIGTLGGYAYTKAQDTLKGTNVAESYDLSAPSPLRTAGDAAQLGLTLLPVGKIASAATAGAKALGAGSSLARGLGEAATSIGTGYAFDLANKTAQGETGSDLFKPGIGTAFGVALPIAGAASGAAKTAAANFAPRLVNSLIKPLLKDFSYGKDPGRTIASMGITGNDFEDLASNIATARQNIGQQASIIGSKLDPQTNLSLVDSLSPINEAMTIAARNNDSTVLNRLQEVKKAITNILLPVSDPITGTISIASTRERQLTMLPYTQALKIKQLVGDLTKFTGNHSDDKAVNMALKKTYGSIKQKLDEAATAVNPQDAAALRDLNEKYADLTSAEIATKYRDKIAERQNIISLPASITGIGSALVTAIATGGSAVPALLAGAGGVALEKALATPAVKTRVASALAKLKPAQAEGLFNKLPFLSKYVAPGDKFIETTRGKNILNYLKNTQIGLSTRDITKLHPEDHDLLVRGYEAYINKTPLSKSDDLALNRLLDHIGIPTNQNITNVTKQMREILDGVRSFRGTDLRNLTGPKLPRSPQ